MDQEGSEVQSWGLWPSEGESDAKLWAFGGKGGKGDGCLKTKKGKSSSKAPKAGKGKGGSSSKVSKAGKGKGKGYFQDDDMDGSYRVNRSKVFKTRRVAERVNRNNKP